MTNELVNAVLESNQASKDGNRTFSMSKGKIGLNIQVGGPFDSLENFGSAFLDLKKEQRDFNLDTTKNVGQGVVGAVKGIPRGIFNFAEEFNRIFLPGYNEYVVPWADENIPGLKELNDFTANMLEYDNKAQTIGGQYIGEPVGEFVIPGATISKGAQAMGMGNKFLANVLGYGTAEAIAVPADEQAMISMGLDLALPNSEIKSLILEGLQADEDAPYIIQKLQKAPENFLGGGYLGEKLDQAISSIGTLYTRIKNSPKLNEMKNNVTESLIKAGDDAQARIDENKGSTQLNTGVDPTALTDQGLALIGNVLRSSRDVVVGDVVTFRQDVFGGSFKNPKKIGERIIKGEVVKESYGADKQQHTFTIRPIEVSGDNASEIMNKKTFRIKGRNLYRYGVDREKWADENARKIVADEKHQRGDKARLERNIRKEGSPSQTIQQNQEILKPIGQKVTHPKFGDGEVISHDKAEGSSIINVKFNDGKIRRIDNNYVSKVSDG
tara:strand:+ start:1351 stop:2841 length:1491 start_codon:yes stop_codon:yes gene_type:complete